MKNLIKVSLMVMGGASFVACSGTLEKEYKRPNIIHIMADDHSFQTISAYGHPISQLAPTPNLDKLASEGMLFTKCYVENSLSAPSRATLLTGRYSHKHGQKKLGQGLDTTLTFFPEMLQDSGYQTAIVGKWHLPCEPKGFNYYKILFDQGDYYNPEFKTKDTHGQYMREEGYVTTLITNYALNWLDSRDKNKPFCLLIHYKAPHRNWMPEQKYLDLYDDVEFPYPVTLLDNYEGRDAAASAEMRIAKHLSWAYDLKVDQMKENDDISWTVKDWERARNRMTSEELVTWDKAYNSENEEMLARNLKGEELLKWKYQRYIHDYVRVIKSVDDQVGRVLDYLKENGLADNTIVIYTSDQGFYMGEHGWFDKRFMYEESFRTPLIIRYPEKMKNKGVKCDALVQNIDFAPTYLSLAGVKQPDWMPGRNIMELIKHNGNATKAWRNTLYYHYYAYPAIHQVRKHDGVTDGVHKLIHFYGKGVQKDKGHDMDNWELYDLEKDPNEIHNIYGKPGYEEITKFLKKELAGYREKYEVEEY